MDAATETTFPRFKTEEGRAKYLAAYDAALATWPVAYEERDVPTALGPTHVIASGPKDAPPLILLPSFAATGLVWRPNIAALAAQHRCYAIDTIGQPGKSAAVRPITDSADYATWLCEVMDGLGVDRAPIVACSFGAFLAAQQSLLTPQRIERVVLIGPPGVFAAMSWRVALLMRTGRMRRQLRKLTGRPEPSAAATLHAGAAPVHAEDGPWRRLMAITMAEGPVLTVTDTRVFTKAEFARIAAPMLLLIGEYERLYDPAETLRRARSLKPGIEAEMVAGADHIAAMAQPDWVNGRVLRFLSSSAPH